MPTIISPSIFTWSSYIPTIISKSILTWNSYIPKSPKLYLSQYWHETILSQELYPNLHWPETIVTGFTKAYMHNQYQALFHYFGDPNNLGWLASLVYVRIIFSTACWFSYCLIIVCFGITNVINWIITEIVSYLRNASIGVILVANALPLRCVRSRSKHHHSRCA